MSTPPQPPQPPKPRMTWVDARGRYWQVQRIGPRWQLSLYRPAVEAWQRVGSWPSRGEAIQPPRTRTSPGDRLIVRREQALRPGSSGRGAF